MTKFWTYLSEDIPVSRVLYLTLLTSFWLSAINELLRWVK
jgi:hypothetical protein